MKKRTILKFLLLTILILSLFIFGCPFYRVFGIPCPACGVTRAWLSFLSSDIGTAFRSHLFFPVIPLIPVLYLLIDSGRCQRLAPHFKKVLYALAGFIFVYNAIRILYGSVYI